MLWSNELTYTGPRYAFSLAADDSASLSSVLSRWVLAPDGSFVHLGSNTAMFFRRVVSDAQYSSISPSRNVHGMCAC